MNDRVLQVLADEIQEAREAAETAAAEVAEHVLSYIAALNEVRCRLPLDQWRAWLVGLDEPIDGMYEMVTELLEITPSGAVFEALTGVQRKLADWMLELRAN
jgi:hypothetical protein